MPGIEKEPQIKRLSDKLETVLGELLIDEFDWGYTCGIRHGKNTIIFIKESPPSFRWAIKKLTYRYN